jgi:thiamine-phosphate pyrophosphorylase
VIAFGPIFDTASKDRPDPVVGLEALSRIKRRVSKPLVAIGGIDADNLESVLAAGAESVAVLGAVCHGDVARNCQRLQSAAKGVR